MGTLTTSGSPTIASSKCTIDSTGSDRVQAPLSLIDPTQAWFAARLIGIAVSANSHHLFSWRPDANNFIDIYLGSTGQAGYWRINRLAGGNGGQAIASSYSGPTGDITVIGAWTATQTKISLNGLAFNTGGNTYIPTFTGTLFDIGRLGDQAATAWLESSIYWCAAGKGTLSDTDASTINGFGNTDPDWENFPSGAEISFLWTCDDFTYQEASSPPAGGGTKSRRSLTGAGR